MEYRKANIDDIDSLIKNRIDMRKERENKSLICNDEEFLHNTYNYFKEHISDDSFIAWVAINNGEIVATSGLCFYNVPPTHNNTTGRIAYIMNMYTQPDFRKRGIASKLLEYLVDEVKLRNCKKITLNASQMGRTIYKKYGFEDVNDSMVFYIE